MVGILKKIAAIEIGTLQKILYVYGSIFTKEKISFVRNCLKERKYVIKVLKIMYK